MSLGGTQATHVYPTLSGTGPVSGVSGVGALSGPWMVEKQQLNFRYKRVPRFKYIPGSVNLSSMNTEALTTATTLLIKLTDVNYKVVKVHDDFSTSTYTQPQRFAVYAASADETGMSYGAVTAGTFSVEGEVITTQDWYFRRLWDDNIDTEISCRLKYLDETPYAGPAYNYMGFNNFDCSVGPPDVNIETPGITEPQFWKSMGWSTAFDRRFKVMDGPNHAFSDYLSCDGFQGSVPPQIDPTISLPTVSFGNKPGAYSSAQDTTDDVQIIVDQIGANIADDFQSQDFQHGKFVDDHSGRKVRNVYYSNTRHYWGL